MHIRSAGRWLCSYMCFFNCRCKALNWLAYTFDDFLLDPDNCSPWFVSVILSMFDLSALGLRCSKGAPRRMQIHPIWRIWHFFGEVVVPFFCQTGLFSLMRLIMTRWLFNVLVGSPEEFVCGAWVCDKSALSIPLNRLPGHNGFDSSVCCIEASTNDDTREIMSLGNFLMWNNSAVCGERVRFKVFLVRFWYGMWKSLERKSAMMFSGPWFFCEYMDVSLLMRFQQSQ